MSNMLLNSAGQLGKFQGCHREQSHGAGLTRQDRTAVQFSQLEHVDWINTFIDDEHVRNILQEAAAARLNARQQLIWLLHQCGFSNTRIAKKLNVGQAAVSRMLSRAKVLIHEHLVACGAVRGAWLMDVRRKVYHAPAVRPPLPAWVQDLRQEIEQEPGVVTVILSNAPNLVEIHKDDELLERLPFHRLRKWAEDRAESCQAVR